MRFAFALLILGACSGGGDDDDDDDVGGSCEAPPADATGEATFYDASGAGNCSFEPTGDLMVAAMNHVDYGTADLCGSCVAIDGPDGSVVVRIVDQCPGCAQGDIDLSRQAFAMIAPLSAGRVPITWREAPCDVDGPISYHFQEGSNPFYTAIQIRNHRYPIDTLEAEVDGVYEPIGRLEYNYFVAADGLGDGPYKLRVTDVRGHVLEDDGVAAGDNESRNGAAQFPLCP